MQAYYDKEKVLNLLHKKKQTINTKYQNQLNIYLEDLLNKKNLFGNTKYTYEHAEKLTKEYFQDSFTEMFFLCDIVEIENQKEFLQNSFTETCILTHKEYASLINI